MKSILVLLALTISISALAREEKNDGRLMTSGGKTIVVVEVGADRATDAEEMSRRIVRLEKAVRDLQNRIYDLEEDAKPRVKQVRMYTCNLYPNATRKFTGKETTLKAAQENAIQACQNADVSFCDFALSKTLKCDSAIETVAN